MSWRMNHQFFNRVVELALEVRVGDSLLLKRHSMGNTPDSALNEHLDPVKERGFKLFPRNEEIDDFAVERFGRFC